MNELFNIQQILECLPHRYPFLLVDRVLECEPDQRLVALKNVTINEPFFMGHFPQRPIMPGVLIIEALAQSAGLLAIYSADKGSVKGPNESLLYFASIDNARFKHVVEPGDQLRLEVNVLKAKRNMWKVHGEAHIENKLACIADFICMRKSTKSDEPKE